MTDAKRYAIRLRRIGNQLGSMVCFGISGFNEGWMSRKVRKVIKHLGDGRVCRRAMRIGYAEDLNIIMAAAIVVHPTVRTFFRRVMSQRNIRQIAHAIVGAQHHA